MDAMTKRVTGEEIACQLSDFVNSAFDSEKRDFVEEVVTDHRTLQQDTFIMFLKCVETWANYYENGLHDPRNEYTCKASKVIIEALKENDLY